MLWERDLMWWERDKTKIHMSPQCCRTTEYGIEKNYIGRHSAGRQLGWEGGSAYNNRNGPERTGMDRNARNGPP